MLPLSSTREVAKFTFEKISLYRDKTTGQNEVLLESSVLFSTNTKINFSNLSILNFIRVIYLTYYNDLTFKPLNANLTMQT